MSTDKLIADVKRRSDGALSAKRINVHHTKCGAVVIELLSPCGEVFAIGLLDPASAVTFSGMIVRNAECAANHRDGHACAESVH